MSTAPTKPKANSRVIGTRAFAAISAVEGLKLSHDSRTRLDHLRSSGLANEEQRSAVRDAYRAFRSAK
jgi:competence protein ComGC